MGTIYIEYDDELKIRSLAADFKIKPKDVIARAFECLDQEVLENYIAEGIRHGSR